MIYIIGNDGTPQRVDGVGNELYPVGSIYMSTTNTSPASMFGGTWEQIKDCFLWATGDITSITYTENGTSVTKSLTAGSRGGELTHTLTVNEMPEHRHAEKWMAYDGGNIYQYYLSYGDGGTLWGLNINKIGGGLPFAGTTATNNSVDSGEAGGSQSHNNMPPYLAVYCWKRIS